MKIVLRISFLLPVLMLPAAHASQRIVQGSAVAVDAEGRWTFAVDTELQRLHRIDNKENRESVEVGAWPEHVVVDAAGNAWVTARAAGRIDVVSPDLQVTHIAVEGEPRSIVLDEAQGRLYVGLVTGRAIVALDLSTRAEVARQSLPVEPWALARVGGSIAALPRLGDSVYFVDDCLCEQKVRRVRLPEVTQTRASVSGQKTVAPARAWFGQALAVTRSGLFVIHSVVETGLDSDPAESPWDGYGAGWLPVRTVVSVIQNGDARLLKQGRIYSSLPISDATDAVFRDDVLYVASRGSGAIVAMPIDRDEMWSPHAIGSGLTGLALGKDGTLVTLAAFDRVVVRLARHPQAREVLEPMPRERRRWLDDWGVTSDGGVWGKGNGGYRVLKERSRVSLGPGALDSEMVLGRKLFYGALDRRVGATGMSCNTCHVDGRQDGLVWRLRGTRRQTPVLAGRLEETAPFGWKAEHATLEDSIASTVKRLGGKGLPIKERKALARFLREGLPPVRTRVGADPAVIERGRQVFVDAEVGCATCHPPEGSFTDTSAHDVGSLSRAERRELNAVRSNRSDRSPAFDTPSLRHLAISAPYLHDGSARTLHDLVERNRNRMGTTDHLSPEDKAALVAYLESL